MTAEIINILTNYGQTTTDQIKAVVPKATGKTAASVRFSVTFDSEKAVLQITGRPYFMTVQTGRKATPQYTKPSRDFVEAIKEWLTAKGGNQSSAYAVALSIHQHGTKLWQQGGNTLISDIVNESLYERMSADLLKQFGKEYITNVANDFRNQ